MNPLWSKVLAERAHHGRKRNYSKGLPDAMAARRIVATGLPLAAGRIAVTIAASASVFLAPHTASAQTAAGVQTDTATCVACHGMRGQGTPAGAPRLAGQNADYMAHALSMFKAGTRNSAIMQPIAQNLSDTRIRDLADYFSNQEAPVVVAGAGSSPQLLLAGKQLAEVGAANVTACFSCHAEQGKGNGARFPRIAGEPTQFVINRLHEFQARSRKAVPQPGTMTAVAATLDESQIKEVAVYLSQLEH
jgi:cytochrome c553